ncbi:MAG: carbon-nitrogen hydrolase [Spirochaetes bacterium]|nr:carbon-nitrogen hydrolase [Spirochaetota bacterium]
MKNKSYNIAVLQLDLNNTTDNNLKKCVSWVKDAAEKGADVAALPELCSSHYFCQSEDVKNFDLAEDLYGPSFKAFCSLAKELGIVIVVPFFEKRMRGIYHNSAYIIDADGTVSGLYRKMHIPDDPGYYEKFYFTPGDTGFKSFNTQKGNIGTLICWDQWYPEAARLTAMQGAEVIFYPTAIGWLPGEKAEYGQKQYEAWRTVMQGHAVANNIYIAAANRIGLEQFIPGTEGIEFWGQSFISGPQGEILAQASSGKEEILIAEVDPAHLEDVRRNWPFFRDRRIDAYGDILKRAIDRE